MLSTYPYFDIHLPRARLAGVDLWKPVAFGGSRKPRYRVTLLLSMDDPVAVKTLEEIIEAADLLWKRAHPSAPDTQLPRPIATPGNAKKDRDGRILRGYERTAVINASSSDRPTLIGRKGKALIRDDGSLRPGDWCHAILRLRTFTGGNNPGVYAELRGVKFLELGETIGFARRDDAKPTEADFNLPADGPSAAD